MRNARPARPISLARSMRVGKLSPPPTTMEPIPGRDGSPRAATAAGRHSRRQDRRGRCLQGRAPDAIAGRFRQDRRGLRRARRIGEGDKAPETSLLAGIVFDASSEPMTPTHAVKKGTRYRYYISRRLIAGPASAIPKVSGSRRPISKALSSAACAPPNVDFETSGPKAGENGLEIVSTESAKNSSATSRVKEEEFDSLKV